MNNKNINKLIEESIELINKSRSKHNDSIQLKELLYLSSIALRLHYGEKIINRLFFLYKNLFIYYSPKSLTNILYNSKEKISNTIINKIDLNSNAISIYGNNSYNYLYISTKHITDYLELIDTFIHELNHIFVGNKYLIKNDHLLNIVGFSIDQIDEYGNIITIGENFNEAINSLTSEDMVKKLLKLSHIKINNPFLKNTFQKIKPYQNYTTKSYTNEVNKLREFYYTKEIYEKIKQSLIHNDYTILESFLNQNYHILLNQNDFIQSLDHTIPKPTKIKKI